MDCRLLLRFFASSTVFAALAASACSTSLAANLAGAPAITVVNAATVDAEDASTSSSEDAESSTNWAPTDQQGTPKPPANSSNAAIPDAWTPGEIANAKARCAVILKRIHAVAIPLPPLKSGACGTPAPVQLISIGKNPEVTLSPPATMTCELAEGLATWLETSLQPLAKKHLASEIISFETMSDYSCRNAYGRKGNKLSEHGHANALDIRSFTTASAKMAIVLDDWGTPDREIRDQIAAQKLLQEKARAAQSQIDAKKLATQKAVPPHPQQPPEIAQQATRPHKQSLPAGTLSEDLPSVATVSPLLTPQRSINPQFSIAEPSRLGGPLLAEVTGSASFFSKRQFLHGAHESACAIFSTTLGPEANAAHRNHFHVDMAPRKTAKICD